MSSISRFVRSPALSAATSTKMSGGSPWNRFSKNQAKYHDRSKYTWDTGDTPCSSDCVWSRGNLHKTETFTFGAASDFDTDSSWRSTQPLTPARRPYNRFRPRNLPRGGTYIIPDNTTSTLSSVRESTTSTTDPFVDPRGGISINGQLPCDLEPTFAQAMYLQNPDFFHMEPETPDQSLLVRCSSPERRRAQAVEGIDTKLWRISHRHDPYKRNPTPDSPIPGPRPEAFELAPLPPLAPRPAPPAPAAAPSKERPYWCVPYHNDPGRVPMPPPGQPRKLPFWCRQPYNPDDPPIHADMFIDPDIKPLVFAPPRFPPPPPPPPPVAGHCRTCRCAPSPPPPPPPPATVADPPPPMIVDPPRPKIDTPWDPLPEGVAPAFSQLDHALIECTSSSSFSSSSRAPSSPTRSPPASPPSSPSFVSDEAFLADDETTSLVIPFPSSPAPPPPSPEPEQQEQPGFFQRCWQWLKAKFTWS